MRRKTNEKELTHGYVSGPMRGRPHYNRDNFARVTAAGREQGFVMFNPFERDQAIHGDDFADDNLLGHDDDFDIRGAMKADCEWICDHANFLIQLDGWEDSLGSRAEAALAESIGMPVISEREFAPQAVAGVSEEVRVTDPQTGGQKGSKLAQLGAVDPRSLMEVAKVAGFGGEKYERYNFVKGYRWSLSYDALQRHLNAWWAGDDNDEESGLSHLAHAAWHCLALMTFQRHGRGTDDRFASALD